jgi:alpha-N-arabinofuranosidase
MKRACLLALALTLGETAPRAAAPTIAIDASTPAGKVSPLLYGLMTDEINHAYDGGLYAELIRNRAFLDDAASPAHWSAVNGDGSAAAIALDPAQPLNAAIATSVRVEVTQASAGHRAGIANEGYWGIPVRPHTRYRASFFAKSAAGFSGPIKAAIESSDGKTTRPDACRASRRRGSSTT